MYIIWLISNLLLNINMNIIVFVILLYKNESENITVNNLDKIQLK